MLYLNVFACVFAAWRLVDLFGQDRITGRFRAAFPSYLWTCPRCLSVWMGGIAALLFAYYPWANWPLALSWLYMWRVEDLVTKPKKKQILIEVSDTNVVSILRSTLEPALAFNALKVLVDTATVKEPQCPTPAPTAELQTQPAIS